MKNNTLAVIAAVSVVVLGVQAYTLYRLNDRVDRLTAQNQSNETSPGTRPNLTKPLTPQPLPNEDFFNRQPWNPYEEMQRMQGKWKKCSASRFHGFI